MRSKVITPQERLTHLPFEPQTTSSNLGWAAIRLEDYRYLPPSDLKLPPMSHHILAFHYKPPQGLLRHRCGEKHNEATMVVEDITYVPANMDNHWEFGGSQPHCLHILLENGFLTQTALTTYDLDAAHLQFVDDFQLRDPHLKHFARLFQAELINQGQTGPLYAETLGTALAIYLLTHHTNLQPKLKDRRRGLSKAQIQATISLMNDRIAEQISLQEMADNLNLSPYYFARLFRQSMGTPPYQYLTQLRLDQAKQLLLSAPQATLATIAQQVGLTDHAYLTRQFHKRFGITPSDYRSLYL